MIKKYIFRLNADPVDREDVVEVHIPEGATYEEVDEILYGKLSSWLWNYVDAYWEEQQK